MIDRNRLDVFARKHRKSVKQYYFINKKKRDASENLLTAIIKREMKVDPATTPAPKPLVSSQASSNIVIGSTIHKTNQ
jgi:dephospho-CoA kinase